MHGLSFETSICYWQDQPGSRHPRRRRGAARDADARPAGHRALPTLTAPALSSPLRPAGAASRTRRWRHGSDGHRRRRPPTSRPGKRLGRGTAPRAELTPGPSLAAREEAAYELERRPTPAGRPFPRRRGQGAGTAAQLLFFFFFRFGRREPFFFFSRPFRFLGFALLSGTIGSRSGFFFTLSRGPRPSRLGLARSHGVSGGLTRPGLTRPQSRPKSTGRARGDSDPTRRARPGQPRPPLAGAARSAAKAAARQRSTGRCARTERALCPRPCPIGSRSLGLSLGLFSASLGSSSSRTAAQKSAARGRHPRALLGPGPAPAPRLLRRTPEDSRGHAAVTQPGSVKTFLPGSGRNDTSPATGSRLERRPPCWRYRTPPRLPPMTEGSSEEPAPPGALSDATRKASSIGRTEKGGRKAAARAATKAPRPQRACESAGHVPERPAWHRRAPPTPPRPPTPAGRSWLSAPVRKTKRSRGRSAGGAATQPAGPRDNANGQQLPPATPRGRPTSHRLCLRKRTAKK